MIGQSGVMIIPIGKRDYSDPSTVPGVGEVGEWRDKLRKTKPGWNDVLTKSTKSTRF